MTAADADPAALRPAATGVTDAAAAAYLRVAVDTGGTFTDLVARRRDGAVERLKVPSTPDDPGRAVRDALAGLRDDAAGVPVAHGTTVATNALLERRLARVVLVTTAGFEDVLSLGRQARPDLYALHPAKSAPVVPRSLTLGIAGRRGPEGQVLESLEDPAAFVERHRAVLAQAEVFAIALLHAHVDGSDERALATALSTAFPERPVVCAHALAPVFREFERTSTAAINAALLPVMGAYLRRLAAALSPAALTVMDSAGTLLDAEAAAVAPVLTVLSGPAGGVRGALAAGLRNGRDRLLAFDMGGTSTDVSVVDGGLEPGDDGHLAEHPLRVPLLPIETVGAGGGSIAFVDAGGALRVGPRSAGAVPGPACYGRGGTEPTVTDAQVVLGRITALLGGAQALDVAAAHAAVGALAAQLGATATDTARAIVAVAEATMARACKRVSMDRGVDPRGLCLVAFGGAGGLHACALAEALGCAEVLFPAEPGVLSAAGILDAPLGVAATAPLVTGDDAEIAAAMARLDAALAASLPGAGAQVSGRVDCRYRGQTHPLPVPLDHVNDLNLLEDRFHARHEARYGHRNDAPIERLALRRFRRLDAPPAPAPGPATAAVLEGPQVLDTYSATLWLPVGWRATRQPSGDWICARIAVADAPTAILAGPSPLALEVHRQRLAAVSEEMGAVLMRAAWSANIKERRDFSCGVFDRHGRMVVHAAHIPVHLGSTPASVRAALDAVSFAPGVQVLLNDPYAGGTHLPDVTLVTPVFVPGEAEPVFFVANRAHHADVGGVSVGSLPAPRRADGTARGLTLADEGLVIPPRILDAALRAEFAAASRTPAERRGDLAAQEAANRVGAERLARLVAERGLAEVEAANDALLDYAERRMRAVLAALPDGEWTFVDHLDDDGLTDTPVPIPVTLRVRGDTAEVDLSAAPDAVAGPLNAPRAIAVSAVFYAFTCLGSAAAEGDEALPANEGLLRPITIRTRPGSILDPFPPAAVSSGNVETSQRVVDALFGALAQAAPDRVPAAGAGSMNNVLFGSLPGAPGPAFVHYETLGGGAGGGPAGPGADAIHVHMTNTLNTPVEALEQAFPVQVVRYAVAPRGPVVPGDTPGGAGLIRSWRFGVPAEVTLMTERRRLPPYGLNGGAPGTLGANRLIRADGKVVALEGKQTLRVAAGDTVEVTTPGGGAWRPLDGRG